MSNQQEVVSNSAQWLFMVSVYDRQILDRLLRSSGVDQPWNLTNGQKRDALFISGYGFNQLINEAYRQNLELSFIKSPDFDPGQHGMCELPVVLKIKELPRSPKVEVLIKLAKDSPERDVLIGFLIQAADSLVARIYDTAEPSHKVIYQTEGILIQTTYNHREIDYGKTILVTSPKDAEVLFFSINQGCTPEQEQEANRLVKKEWLPTILEYARISQIETSIQVITRNCK